MEPLKPDCACAQQRKTLESWAAGSGGTLSPVRFDGETCAIAAISSDFQKNAAGFLCNPDCVAEREGFEPRGNEHLGQPFTGSGCREPDSEPGKQFRLQ